MALQLKAFPDPLPSAQLVIVTQKVSKPPHVAFCRSHILHVKLCSWIDSLMLSAPCCYVQELVYLSKKFYYIGIYCIFPFLLKKFSIFTDGAVRYRHTWNKVTAKVERCRVQNMN